MDSKTWTRNEFSQSCIPTSCNIIDNFLPDQQFNEISQVLMGTGMAWNWCDLVEYPGGSEDKYQLTHTIFNSPEGYISPLSRIVQPFIDALKVRILLRIKANLNLRSKEEDVRTENFHYDHEFIGSKLPDGTLTSYTSIYYVNTNNGYTLFKDGNFKVDSVANRMVIFDSSKLHKVVGCTDEKRRVVINFNYFTHEYGTIDQYQKCLKVFKEANA